MNILLVKEHSRQESLLAEHIRSLGYDVTICVPGTAMEYYRQNACALLILEMEATRFNASPLGRQLQTLPEEDRGLIWLMADGYDPQNSEAALAARVDEYLCEPIPVEQLKIRLAAIERQFRYVTQLKAQNNYLTGILHVIRDTSRLIGKEKDHHQLLEKICATLAKTYGVLSAQIDLLDESGFLVKVAESEANRESGDRAGTSAKITTWLDHAGTCYGAMTVLLSSMLASTETAHGFLKEVALDLASALYSIESDQKRRRTEHALVESQTRYRELGDTITDPFFAFDKDLIVTYWNRAAENFTGIPMPDALGKSLYAIFPNIPGTEAEEGYLQLLQTRQPQSFIQMYPLKGKTFFFEVSIYPSRDSFSVFAKDITLRKQMEDALKKSWDYLENLNNSLGDAIFTVKMPEQVIEYVNRAVETIFGYTVEECIGQNTAMFFPRATSSHDFSSKLAEAIQQKRDMLRTEYVLQRKQGQKFAAEIITTFFRQQAEPTGIISIVRDITDRKRMELTLKRERASLTRKVEARTVELKRMNAELARASQLKDEFMANMSHELRTPLNAILGYAKILKKATNLSQLQLEGLETIQSSGEHLLNLINDILDLAKIEAGRLELHPTQFHFPEYLQQIANIIRIRTEHKAIAFIYEPDQNLPIGVCTDEKRLREVLINLLDNAVKFTEKGMVSFKVYELPECAELKNSQTQQLTNSATHKLRFEVKDTGSGIAPEQLAAIFLPFQRVGKQRYATEGTGLGLSISQQLVNMMGGELCVESTLGEGSTFWFESAIPEVSESCLKTGLPPPEIVGYRGAQRTVLIVDDKRENRAVLIDMLLPLGFEILEAANGQECLDVVGKVKPDVILLDLRMPVLDGFETAWRIRASPETQGIKLVAISASVFAETRKASLAIGCDAFLSKPLAEEQLLECLRSQLKLEWLYRDALAGISRTETQTSALSLTEVAFPAEEAAILRQLAGYGNITRFLDQLTHIAGLGEQYLPLVTELRKLAKSFQMPKIVAYFEQLEKTHEG